MKTDHGGKLYIVIDDVPPEMGTIRIITIHASKIGAKEYIESAKRDDDYAAQYLCIIERYLRR